MSEEWKNVIGIIGEEVDWVCPECGKQCRRPGEKFDHFGNTLTIIHINHDMTDYSPENLKAACLPCRLRYDEDFRNQERLKTRKKKVVPFGKNREKLL